MLLIKNANIYGEEIADILVANGKIEAIHRGIANEIQGALKEQAQIVDAECRTVIPALIDQHVHVTGGGGEGGMTTRCPELSIADIVDAGVGTIVGLLGTDGITRSVENLAAKTRALREYGFYAHCLTGAYEVPSPTITGSVMKDIAFIDECIGLKIAISDHRCSHPTYEELVRLAGQVRLGGLIGKKAGVMHIHVGLGKQGLSQIFDILNRENIPASVFRPTHMNGRLDETIRLTKLGSYSDLSTGADHQKTAAAVLEAIKKSAPGKITMSSDANGSLPKWNEKKEIVGMGIGMMNTLYGAVKSLVKDFGLSLREALAPCTENVVAALNMFPYVGALQSGSRADMLILDDNLEINDFILAGNFVMRDKKRTLKINFED